jgi:hypothetical protein
MCVPAVNDGSSTSDSGTSSQELIRRASWVTDFTRSSSWSMFLDKSQTKVSDNIGWHANVREVKVKLFRVLTRITFDARD